MVQEEKRSQSRTWLGRFSFPQVDIWLGVLVTLAGLTLFAYSGFNPDSRAGFVFLQNIEQRSLDMRFGMRGDASTRRSHRDRRHRRKNPTENRLLSVSHGTAMHCLSIG